VDFGLCMTGSSFQRVINVLNVGNIGYSFEIVPDPTDTGLVFAPAITDTLSAVARRIRLRTASNNSLGDEADAVAPKPPPTPSRRLFSPRSAQRAGRRKGSG